MAPITSDPPRRQAASASGTAGRSGYSRVEDDETTRPPAPSRASARRRRSQAARPRASHDEASQWSDRDTAAAVERCPEPTITAKWSKHEVTPNHNSNWPPSDPPRDVVPEEAKVQMIVTTTNVPDDTTATITICHCVAEAPIPQGTLYNLVVENNEVVDKDTHKLPVWVFEAEHLPWELWQEPFFYFKVDVHYGGLHAETPKDHEKQTEETLRVLYWHALLGDARADAGGLFTYKDIGQVGGYLRGVEHHRTTEHLFKGEELLSLSHLTGRYDPFYVPQKQYEAHCGACKHYVANHSVPRVSPSGIELLQGRCDCFSAYDDRGRRSPNDDCYFDDYLEDGSWRWKEDGIIRTPRGPAVQRFEPVDTLARCRNCAHWTPRDWVQYPDGDSYEQDWMGDCTHPSVLRPQVSGTAVHGCPHYEEGVFVRCSTCTCFQPEAGTGGDWGQCTSPNPYLGERYQPGNVDNACDSYQAANPGAAHQNSQTHRNDVWGALDRSADLAHHVAANAAMPVRLWGSLVRNTYVYHHTSHGSSRGLHIGKALIGPKEIRDKAKVPSVPRYLAFMCCCSTGRNPDVAGAFMARGTKFVIGFRRPVMDLIVRQFSRDFYRLWCGTHRCDPDKIPDVFHAVSPKYKRKLRPILYGHSFAPDSPAQVAT